jgi:hypothetical protein
MGQPFDARPVCGLGPPADGVGDVGPRQEALIVELWFGDLEKDLTRT